MKNTKLNIRSTLNTVGFDSLRRLRVIAWAAVLIGAGFVLPAAVAGDSTIPLKNLGMEEGDGNPSAWQKGGQIPGVLQTWDQTTAHNGKASLCFKKTAQRYFPIAHWSQSVILEPLAKPQKLRVRCWVKAEKVTKAIIDVTHDAKHTWAVYLGQKQPTDPVLTHDWKQYEAVVPVPAKTSELGIALQIYGPGTVWFDDLEVAWVE